MLELLIVVSTVAGAAPVKFCFLYNVDLDDAEDVGDDYINDNSVNYAARGTWARVKETATNTGVWTGYTADGAPAGNPGCTPTLNLTLGTSYTVTIRSENQVRGNMFYLYDDDSSLDLYYYIPTTTYQPPMGGETRSYVVPTQDWWSNAAVAAWSFWQNDTGSRGNIVLYMSGCGLLIDGTCCENDDVYVGGQTLKGLLAHNIGHCVWTAEGGPNLPLDYPAALYELEEMPCDVDYSTHDFPHYLLSKEYQAANVWEGWAHFYWANTFNDGSEWEEDDECFVNYYDPPADWNQDNNNDVSEYDPIVSCAGSTNVEDAEDDYWDYCYSGTAAHNENVGVAYDWMRYYWDYAYDDSSFDFTPQEILDLILESDPSGWTINNYGSGSGYPKYEMILVGGIAENASFGSLGTANGVYQ